MRKLSGLALIFALAWMVGTFWPKPSPVAPNVPATEEKGVAVSPPPAKVPRGALPRLTSKKVQLTRSYPFSLIERKLRDENQRIADCLMLDTTLDTNRVQLRVEWSPEAELKKLSMTPEPKAPAIHCLETAFRQWKLPPHPGLQPFGYSVVLSF